MIKPTIGRAVWFTPSGPSDSLAWDGKQPLAAIVAYVWSDTMVNLSVFDQNGKQFGQTSVFLYQGDTDRPKGYYCEWMPYQQGQAAKAEALEKQLNEAKS